MISVICATRGRPEWCKRMWDSLRDTQKGPVEYLFWVDNDDPELSGYRDRDIPAMVGPPVGAIVADNILAAKANGHCFVMGDDAVMETEGWNEIFEEKANEYPDGVFVFGTDDGRGEPGHFCIGRGWRDALGSILPGIFVHWHADTWTLAIAKKLGRYTEVPVVVPHYKGHLVGETDQTWMRLRANGLKERDAMVAKTCQRYQNLDYSILKRRIESE